MTTPTSVNVARVTYVLICELLALAVALTFQDVVPVPLALLMGLLVAGFFILIETTLKGFTLRGFSTAAFGLGVGLFCAWLITRVDVAEIVASMVRELEPRNADRYSMDELRVVGEERAAAVRLAINVTLYASLGFLGAVIALRGNRDDFAFIIPFVRFRQEGHQGRPIVMDAAAVMDGRVINVARSGFLGGRLIIPRYVLLELQALANSNNASKQQRGQRGLAILEQMQADKSHEVIIHDAKLAEQDSIESKLIETAKVLGARLLTNDENLSKIARMQNIDVLNLYELTDALKPNVSVGEIIRIALVRNGKEEHQALGYLADGTMVVVNHSAALVGTTQTVRMISTLSTPTGLIVFAEVEA